MAGSQEFLKDGSDEIVHADFAIYGQMQTLDQPNLLFMAAKFQFPGTATNNWGFKI